MLGGIFLLLTIGAIQFSSLAYASSDAYDSGYDHGCDDAGISDSGDRYINQPEKGPAFHTGTFMRGYNEGFDACSDSSEGGNASPSDDSNRGQGGSIVGNYADGYDLGKENGADDYQSGHTQFTVST